MGQRRSGQRKSRIEIASLARAHTETVIKVLVGIVTREDAAPNARIAAGLALLDRGWGKPLQKIELDDDRPGEIGEIVITIVDPKDPDNPTVLPPRGGTNSRALLAPEPSETELVPETPQA
jgi:hypothetical protein